MYLHSGKWVITDSWPALVWNKRRCISGDTMSVAGFGSPIAYFLRGGSWLDRHRVSISRRMDSMERRNIGGRSAARGCLAGYVLGDCNVAARWRQGGGNIFAPTIFNSELPSPASKSMS